MKKKLGLVLAFAILGLMVCNANALTSAASMLSNIAMVTAQNAPANVMKMTNITTATMWGGVMRVFTGSTDVQLIGNNQRFKWVIQLSNLGNASAQFGLRVRATNKGVSGGTTAWGYSFTNGSPVTIPVGSFLNFGFIISNTIAMSNNAYYGCLIQASNISAGQNPNGISARAYLGWGISPSLNSNTPFGGTLATATNGLPGANWGPVVVLQHRIAASGSSNRWGGFLVAQISGPVLSITKTVVSISHSSGLYSGAGNLTTAEPGALITYKIYVTNSGSRAATNVSVIDTIKTNFFSTVTVISQGRTFSNSTGVGANGRMAFTSERSNNRFPNGSKDRIYIRVRVR